MRSLGSLTLAMLTLTGLIVAPLTFSDSATAASTKVAHKSCTASQSLCARPLKFSAQQLIAAMISRSMGQGPPDALIIDGVRVPIGDCGPSAIDPYTGEPVDNRPTQSGPAWIKKHAAHGT
jgi:hypothetical protein